MSYQNYPGQNGPGSDNEGGSAANSPAMHGSAGPPGGPTAMNLENKEDVREQDRLLPIANISRIMKRVLPEHAKMSKEAKAALQECVSEFIGFITSEASDKLIHEKRKTITGDDIIDSMHNLGFDSYMEFLKSYLKKYRQSNKPTKTGSSSGGGGGGAGEKNQQGAHKRGRKARGGDDDEDEHSASPPNVPHDAAAAAAAAVASGYPPGMQQMLAQQYLQQQQQQEEIDEKASKRRKAQ